jgi:hypothetical protein
MLYQSVFLSLVSNWESETEGLEVYLVEEEGVPLGVLCARNLSLWCCDLGDGS